MKGSVLETVYEQHLSNLKQLVGKNVSVEIDGKVKTVELYKLKRGSARAIVVTKNNDFIEVDAVNVIPF